MDALKATPSVDGTDLEDYSTIFFTGGHGTMWDFPDSADLQRTPLSR
ncbi:hypothetical protein ABZZ80_02825 [Streptomyces sp. NPDC006356]